MVPSAPAYSPIVLAGIVRLIELAITAAIGFAVYAAYVVPVEGFEWHYGAAILAIAGMAMVALQAADVYQVQAFRGHEKQYMRLASAWSIVFLLAISISFFAKAGNDFSRVWLGSFYALGLLALIAFRRGLFLLVRRWTREGRLDRRTVVVGADARGESLIKSIVAQRDNDVRIFQPIVRVHRAPERHLCARSRRMRACRVPLMPARFGKLAQHCLNPVAQRWRCDGLRQNSQALAATGP